LAGGGAKYAIGPTRVQYQNKDPRGWREFAAGLADHSPRGASNTLRGVQKRRPLLFQLVDGMRRIAVTHVDPDGDEANPASRPDCS